MQGKPADEANSLKQNKLKYERSHTYVHIYAFEFSGIWVGYFYYCILMQLKQTLESKINVNCKHLFATGFFKYLLQINMCTYA